MELHTQYDYIVIGAGTAGCCLANRLSADCCSNVLLIEAGPPDDHPLIHDSIVPKIFGVWSDRRYTANYPLAEDKRLGPRLRSISRGVMLGGCSSNNAMIHVRGDQGDFDSWQSLGNKGWRYDDVLPFFKKSESFEGHDSEVRGREGPISVRMLPRPTRAATEFVELALDLGFKGGSDYDLNKPCLRDKVGYFQYSINGDNTRCSSAVGYLRPIEHRKNLHILTHHRAIKLLSEKRDCGLCVVQGVACADTRFGFVREFKAEKEVIMCGGAIGTPQLLLLSGIGPASDLESLGIETMHPLPVGYNLHDHMILVLRFETKEKLTEQPMFISEAGLYLNVKGAVQCKGKSEINTGCRPNIQYFAHTGIKELLHFSPETKVSSDYLVMAPTLVRPKSRGKLSLISTDPRIPPRIDPGYLTDEEDLATLMGSVEQTRVFAAENGLIKTNGVSDLLDPGSSSDALAEYIRHFARGLWHPVGTCKMAPDDAEDAVVDNELRVIGVDKLRVCDASIMPEIVSSNTNPTTLMIAEKAAELIIASYST